ncbi:MAG: C40 family peptidase [Chlamydiia bacterium]|nr:C40 family peptidase [Chlamydiia bacterium]
MYFVTEHPTPVLNTPHFNKVYGQTLPFDDQHLVRALEFIAFPGETFNILNGKEGGILEVISTSYPFHAPLYADCRFGKITTNPGKEIEKALPSQETVLERLCSKVGLPYVWGGNWSTGLSLWEHLYPPPKDLSPFERAHWTLTGLDCSGFLYEATGGITPRNTSGLMNYGVKISRHDLQPLDVILYPGHNLIVLNTTQLIECCHEKGGVVISSIEERLNEITLSLTFRRFF